MTHAGFYDVARHVKGCTHQCCHLNVTDIHSQTVEIVYKVSNTGFEMQLVMLRSTTHNGSVN